MHRFSGHSRKTAAASSAPSKKHSVRFRGSRRASASFALLRAFVLLLVAAAVLLAQNRANFPWWNSPIIDDPQLALTQVQKQRIRQIVRSYRNRLLDARNNANKAELDLDDLLNDQDVSPQAAQAVIQKAADARASASRVFLEMSFQIRSVLTLDQWRELVRRWDEVKKKRPQDTQVPPE